MDSTRPSKRTKGSRSSVRTQTLASITFQNYFRMYKKLAGMTGTADTEAAEFYKIYNLDVTVDTDKQADDPAGKSGRRLPHRRRKVPQRR